MPDKNDAIGSIAKKIKSERILLTGAGASAAAGIPTMTSFLSKAYGSDFVEKIKSEAESYEMATNSINQIATNKQVILKRLFHAANLEREHFSCDLEILFEFIHRSPIGRLAWKNEQWDKQFLHLFDICVKNQRNDYAHYRKQYRSFKSRVSKWMDEVDEVIMDLRRKMQESFFVSSNEREILNKALDTYRILPRLFNNGPSIVFTLNFDTIFESLENQDVFGYQVIDGTTPSGRSRQFAFKNFDVTKPDPLYLFKLHGSVNWVHEEGVIRDSYPDIVRIGEDSRAVMAEPVLSKRPIDFPFKQMYDLLDELLHHARECVVIGISFRDDTLRELISSFVESGSLHLIIIVPEEESDLELNHYIRELDKYDNVTWIKQYFGTEEAEAELFTVLKK